VVILLLIVLVSLYLLLWSSKTKSITGDIISFMYSIYNCIQATSEPQKWGFTVNPKPVSPNRSHPKILRRHRLEKRYRVSFTFNTDNSCFNVDARLWES